MSAALFAVAVVAVAVLARLLHRRRARGGRVDRLRAMLAKRPALVRETDERGATPLHLAAGEGDVESMRLLLDHGADVGAGDREGVTPLHFAAAFGGVEAVRLLLERGAQVDAREETGMTPIMGAQAHQRAEVVEVLRQAGATLDEIPPVLVVEPGHVVTHIAADDPLLRLTTRQSQESLPTLRELVRRDRRGATVKFAVTTDRGTSEHLWGEVLELTDAAVRIRVKTPPISHAGAFEKVRLIPLREIEDWQVEQRDGRVRGGFSYQVMFHRTRESLGQLPSGLAEHERRFVDHDLPALLRAAESPGA